MAIGKRSSGGTGASPPGSGGGGNPNTVLKAYRELETKGLTVGLPGQGTFIEATLSQVALPELTALRRSLSGWLAAADGPGWTRTGSLRCPPARCGISMSAAGGRAPAAVRTSGKTEGVA